MQLDRKRVLLIHPLGGLKGTPDTDIARKANIMPPLGLASIAAWIEHAGMRADIADFNAVPEEEARLKDLLETTRPAFVGFSCTTSAFLDGAQLAGQVKQWMPDITTVVGGVHVSATKEEALRKFPQFDYGIAGEGEATLAALMKGETDDGQGLVYRRDGEVKFGGYRKPALDLDTLPFPAYEKLPGYPRRYTLPIFNYPSVPNASCISSRGCPNSCSYCDRSVFGPTFRFNSARYLYEHMKYLRDRFGIRHLNFYDDQFTLNRQRLIELGGMLADAPLGMTFNCAARPDKLDRELLAVMADAGCWMISLGIETGDSDLLARHRSHADLDTLRERVAWIRQAGIRVKGLVMVGLPGETEATIRQSMRYVHSLPLDDLNVAKFTPFPGTPLYSTIRQHGTFDEDWSRMDCMHFVFVPRDLTARRMQELFQEFYKRHYTRWRIMWGYIAMLWKSPDSWRRFVADLGAYLSFASSNKRWKTK